MSALAIVYVAADIFVTVWPGHHTLGIVHHVIAPLTFVALTVWPSLDAVAVFLVVGIPLAFVESSVFDFLLVFLDSRRFNHLQKVII